MVKDLDSFLHKAMVGMSFNTIAVAVVDFKTGSINALELESKKIAKNIYFDLASLTKPLTLSATKLIYPELFKKDLPLELLLSHKASLPSGGRLSRDSWMDQILSYKIIPGETLYSDYGALRLMLELERKSQKDLKSLCDSYWDRELLFWKDLPKDARTPFSGFRSGEKIKGQVNDDNAFIIGRFCSHAGLFSTVSGLAKSLINLNEKHDLLASMLKVKFDGRFVDGWDSASGENSLAGKGYGPGTFGHLGFTGTSMWIDPHKQKGQIILTNATQNYWYHREGLNNLRRSVGEFLWKWI
jgi:CubicO group peptidase (beta-lactamase class C family)